MRNHKVQTTQRNIEMHPDRFGNNYNDVNNRKKDKLIKETIKDGYGNSLITDMSGCPIQKVHKIKEKRREKLKKYLYQGKNSEKHSYDKYKLQNGNAVSIEITPDYNFRRILDPQKAAYGDEIMDQIRRNCRQRDEMKRTERENDQREQK